MRLGWPIDRPHAGCRLLQRAALASWASALLACALPVPAAHAQTPAPVYERGLRFLDPTLYQSIPLAAPPLMGELPRQVDLSPRFPRAGTQGKQSSCVGWAVAYALKSYQEAVERSWSADAPDRTFSPAYIYNQIKQGDGCQGGAALVDALNLLRREGVATLRDFPYTDQDCTRQPNAAVKQAARQFAVAEWRRVNVQDDVEVKSQLAAGFPVLIGMMVDEPFMKLRGTQVYVYAAAGSGLGGHAMVVVGYDDGRQAYRVLNSWGTEWGEQGLGWIAYAAFRQRVREAYSVQDIVTVRPPSQPEAVTPTNPPSPTQPPAPTPVPMPIARPETAVGTPIVQHNMMVPNPIGAPAPGMVLRLPGSVTNAAGKQIQLVARFRFPDGRALVANVQERTFRDTHGLVATGTAQVLIPSQMLDVGSATMTVPYYALNLQPTNYQMVYPLIVTVDLFLDNFLTVSSPPASFTVRW